MKFIELNPYRIIGLLSKSSEKDIQKQKSKITRYVIIGKQIESEFDFPFLGKIIRAEKTINQAFSAIEQNQDRVSHSLFWFLNLNSFDETAINYLLNGDKDKAVEVWEKVTSGKELTTKNYSCFNNLGTIYLSSDAVHYLKKGLELKIKLIESSCFVDFVHSVADQTVSVNTTVQIEKFINQVFSELQIKFSSNDILKLFQDCGDSVLNIIKLKLVAEPIQTIEDQITNTKNNRKSNQEVTNKLGLLLFENCKNELETLKNILGEVDLKYTMIADNLAKEIMQCGIDYYNESIDSVDSIENALKLLNLARSIATGTQTLDRISSNIDAIIEVKDKEISSAIEFMKSVKKAYEENKAKIMVQVHSTPLGHNQTINWSKVNSVIEGSIDWNKVVELLIEIIPPENLVKIKSCQDAHAIEEFKSNLDFIVSKLSYLQVNKIKYLNYWKTEDTISNVKFTFKSLPAWIKWLLTLTILFLIVWLIWGDEGLETGMGILGFFGLMYFLGWAQNR
jgi:hypothetical protein